MDLQIGQIVAVINVEGLSREEQQKLWSLDRKVTIEDLDTHFIYTEEFYGHPFTANDLQV